MCGEVQRLGSVKVDSLARSAHGLFLAYGNMNARFFVAWHVWLHLSRPSWAAAPPGMILVMKMLGSSPTCGLSVPPAMLKPRPELPCRSKQKHITIHIRGIWLWLQRLEPVIPPVINMLELQRIKHVNGYKQDHFLRLTLSSVISSYSISPSVPFTCRKGAFVHKMPFAEN